MRLGRTIRSPLSAAIGLAAAVAAMVMPSARALGGEAIGGKGIGEGHPPQRVGLSPAQRRLMARRAADVTALRNGLAEALDAARPGDMRSGQIEIHGRIGGYRLLESRELPDGRWRSIVEVTLPAPPHARKVESTNEIVTDYLLLRSSLLSSRRKCDLHRWQLEHELKRCDEAIHRAVAEALDDCRADLAVIDRALADLEAKTVTRLLGPTTTSAPAI